jgi:hypothetical protein
MISDSAMASVTTPMTIEVSASACTIGSTTTVRPGTMPGS